MKHMIARLVYLHAHLYSLQRTRHRIKAQGLQEMQANALKLCD